MIKNNPLISVIVPVYNTGEYLIPCLESILGQTYQNLELLLVDDGSTDGSGAVCGRYAEKDPRVRVFHQENRGAGAARNYGMDQAAGECLAFIDSDDYIAPDYLDTLLQNLLERDADIVCARILRCETDGSPCREGAKNYLPSSRYVKMNRLVRERWELLEDILRREEIYFTHVVAALFRREKIRTVRFPDLWCGEDSQFMFDLFRASPTVYLSEYTGYYNVLKPNSITRGVPHGFYLQPRKAHILLFHYELAHLPEPTLKNAYFLQYATSVHAFGCAMAQPVNREERADYQAFFQEHLQQVLSQRARLPVRFQFWLLLCSKAPHLYSLLVCAKERIKAGRRTVSLGKTNSKTMPPPRRLNECVPYRGNILRRGFSAPAERNGSSGVSGADRPQPNALLSKPTNAYAVRAQTGRRTSSEKFLMGGCAYANR